MVGPSGLEPPTSCLSGTRSNHLSYEPLSGAAPLPGFAFIFPFRSSSARNLYLSFLDPDPCPVVEMMGFEPMTPCLQGRCSPSWATPPYMLPSANDICSADDITSWWYPFGWYPRFRSDYLDLCLDYGTLLFLLKDPSKLNNESNVP